MKKKAREVRNQAINYSCQQCVKYTWPCEFSDPVVNYVQTTREFNGSCS